MFSHGELAYIHNNRKCICYFKDSSAGFAAAVESDDRGLQHAQRFLLIFFIPNPWNCTILNWSWSLGWRRVRG